MMKFYYFTDESEKSLVPFLSTSVLTAIFYGVLMVGGAALVFWPWQSFSSFLVSQKTPLIFFVIFAMTLIITSYINLRCGRGEMVRNYLSITEYQKEAVTFEKEYGFFQYGLIEFLLHTLFLIFPFVPLFILATSVSGLSLLTFLKAFAIVFTASLLCRLFGFLMYLFWGRSGLLGYLLSRIFLAVFLFVTAILASEVNPIIPIYEMNRSLEEVGLFLTSSYALYMATVIVAIGLLVIVNQMLVKHYIHKSHENQ